MFKLIISIMKKIYSIRTISLLFLLASFGILANAATLRDTKTGLVITQGGGTGSAGGGSLSLPSSTIVNTNNGWNGYMITSIGETGSDYYAQSFIADVTNITRFGVVIQEVASEGQVILAIAEDNGGVPNYAAPLYVGTIINPTPTATWYYETGLNIPVNIGQKYYVLIDGYNNPGATGYAGIGYSDTQPIPGEGIIWSNYGGVGAWDFMTDYPLAIYVEGTPPPVPVPFWAIALVFVAIGIGGFFAYRRKMVKQAV
jgi:hypothetical protein